MSPKRREPAATFLPGLKGPSRQIDRAESVLGELTLVVRREDGRETYEIRLDGRHMIESRGGSSERALADRALERLEGSRRDLRVLVGGLGAGHTLRQVLSHPEVGSVRVVEISESVGRWNWKWQSGKLSDPRTELVIGDLFEVLSEPANFDAILVDVDNGPANLAASRNSRLYGNEGLSLYRRKLRRGGVLGIWSSHRAPELKAAMKTLFVRPEEFATSTDAPGGRPDWLDWLYLGSR